MRQDKERKIETDDDKIKEILGRNLMTDKDRNIQITRENGERINQRRKVEINRRQNRKQGNERKIEITRDERKGNFKGI